MLYFKHDQTYAANIRELWREKVPQHPLRKANLGEIPTTSTNTLLGTLRRANPAQGSVRLPKTLLKAEVFEAPLDALGNMVAGTSL